MCNSDIICLNETKTDTVFHFAGYKTYSSSGSNAHRGGCAVLIKNRLAEDIAFMDISNPDMVLMRFMGIPITFISCYIPPHDSPLFSLDNVAILNSKLREDSGHFVILGDLNARYAHLRSSFLPTDDVTLSYARHMDAVPTPNANAQLLCGVLSEHTVLLNGLLSPHMTLPCDLTFRQKSRGWISELDHVYVSRELIPAVQGLAIDQDVLFPSNHAPVRVTLELGEIDNRLARAEKLSLRANLLGDNTTVSGCRGKGLCQRQIRITDVDCVKVSELLQNVPPPDLDTVHSVQSTMENIDRTIQQVLRASRPEVTPCAVPGSSGQTDSNRWNRVAQMNDPKELWRAIGWNGKVQEHGDKKEQPSDENFKAHFEELLCDQSLSGTDLLNSVPNNLPYIPVLDDDFTPVEVQEAIDSLKRDRSGGPSGVPPGVMKLLPAQWIIFITAFFSIIFRSASAPSSWAYSRLVVLFKKGNRMDAGNYRGLSVMDSFAKLYDCLLVRRLERWFRPSREQAGAQRGRGCQEHILSLRLLMDYAKCMRVKLFIIYVDYRKAYDMTPRTALIAALASLGCGYAMTTALAALYSDTRLVLGSVAIIATLGLRQGSPTSCFLFTLYLEKFVRRMKTVCGEDGFLKWLHCLLLMDDTVIFATSRVTAIQKLHVLTDFCASSGMVVNDSKTKFMVINGDKEDRATLMVDGLSVQNCEHYTYLGVVITQDGSPESTVREHLKTKQSQVTKFASFIRTNADAPFSIKRKVFDAAIVSTVMYGCEAWIGSSSRLAEKIYMTAVKTLLGVRVSTTNNVCLVELGVPSIQAKVKDVQSKFVQKMLRSRQDRHHDDPFMFVWTLCEQAQTSGYKYFRNVMETECHITEDILKRQLDIRRSDRTKSITYVYMNPELSVCPMYAGTDVAEYQRLVYTRFRVSSHRLAIETGRWSRIPRESRLCSCGAVQTEEHVVCFCPLTAHVRQKFNLNISRVGEINSLDVPMISKLVYECANILKF